MLTRNKIARRTKSWDGLSNKTKMTKIRSAVGEEMQYKVWDQVEILPSVYLPAVDRVRSRKVTFEYLEHPMQYIK